MKTQLINRKKVLLMFAFLGVLMISSAQSPPPPGGGTGSTGHDPIGGNAPVGEGLVILIASAMAYGVKTCRKQGSAEGDKFQQKA